MSGFHPSPKFALILNLYKGLAETFDLHSHPHMWQNCPYMWLRVWLNRSRIQELRPALRLSGMHNLPSAVTLADRRNLAHGSHGTRMATQPLPDIPEGFDSLSKEQQIEYLHALWDRIASSQDEVPVPQWHRDLLRQRLDSRDSSEDTTWSQLKSRLLGDDDG